MTDSLKVVLCLYQHFSCFKSLLVKFRNCLKIKFGKSLCLLVFKELQYKLEYCFITFIIMPMTLPVKT